MDGRHRRRERTHQAVLQAVIANGLEDIEVVARAADTSKRTIFRLFGDMEALRRAAARSGLATAPMKSGRERIPSFVICCTEPYIRLGALLDSVGPDLADRQASLIEVHFGTDLYPLQVHAIAVLTSWPAWRSLIADRGCSEATARRVLEIGVKRLVR